MKDNTINLYESAIREWDLIIHAQREKVRMICSKYDGEFTEEVAEVTAVLQKMELSRSYERAKRDDALKAIAVQDFMIRMEDDEL